MVTDRIVTAFCPGHISGYFRRVTGHTAATTGSIGAGLVISEGVVSRVRPAERTAIEVRSVDATGKPVTIAHDSPPVRSAMDKAGVTARVTTECRLPVGAGFGLSAAALLSTLTALNRLYDLSLNDRAIARLAHESEILHRTGLGDVAACRGGGMVVRTFAGIDAPVKRFFDGNRPVCAVSFGPIHTPSVLSSGHQMDRVKKAFPADEPDGIDGFFIRAQDFTRKSGLMTPQVKKALSLCNRMGVAASMTMLGNGVFAYGENAVPILSRFGQVHAMTIAKGGPRVLEGML